MYIHSYLYHLYRLCNGAQPVKLHYIIFYYLFITATLYSLMNHHNPPPDSSSCLDSANNPNHGSVGFGLSRLHWPLKTNGNTWHITPFKPALSPVWPLWLAWAIDYLYTNYSISHSQHSLKRFPFIKQSAIHLSPYSSSHPPPSPPSMTHPQPSTYPLPYPPISQHTDGRMSQSVTHRHGPSTLAMSLLPPGKRQSGEPSPCDDIAHTWRALSSRPPHPIR